MYANCTLLLLLGTFVFSSVSCQGDSLSLFDQLISAAANILQDELDKTDDAVAAPTTHDKDEATEPVDEDHIEQEMVTMRKTQLMERLKRVEQKMKELKYYLAQEAAVDAALESLDTKLKQDFKLIKEKVGVKTLSMKRALSLQLDDMKTTLTSVDKLARPRNKEVAGAIYHGGIGSVCVTGSSECRLPLSLCQDRVCQCEPGLSYDALQLRCVVACRHYGDTFQTSPNFILRGFNTHVLNGTIAECKAACMQCTDFVCRSIEYFPRWGKCYLSDVLASNETDEAWEYNSAGSHYQRDCAYY